LQYLAAYFIATNISLSRSLSLSLSLYVLWDAEQTRFWTSDWRRGFYTCAWSIQWDFTQKTIWAWRSSNKLDRDQPFIFFPFLFILVSLCRRYSLTVSVHHFIICGVGYFCQGESVDVPAARAIDLSNTEWLGEKLVLCNKFESLSFVNLCFFAL
jgi:hypothetical protein